MSTLKLKMMSYSRSKRHRLDEKFVSKYELEVNDVRKFKGTIQATGPENSLPGRFM